MLSKLFKKKRAVSDPPAASQISPSEIFTARGDNCVQNGDYNTAVIMYTEALKENPSDTSVLQRRSLAHTMSTPPRLDLALQDADLVIQYHPTDWRAWLQKGETLLKLGLVNEAEEALLNAVGFAGGLDKATAQRSLADARTRRNQIVPTPAVKLQESIPPAVPFTAIPTGAMPPAQAITQPTTNVHSPSIQPFTPVQSPPVARPAETVPIPTPPAPITNPTFGNQISPETRFTRVPGPSMPAASSSVPRPAGNAPYTATPTPTVTRPTFGGQTPLTTKPSPVPVQSTPLTSSPVLPAVSNPLITIPPASSNLPSGGTSRNTAERSVPISRALDSSSVSEAPVSSLPLRAEDLIDLTSEAPPGYTPAFDNPDPTVRALSVQALTTQLTQLQTALAVKNKGSISIRPYTAPASIDAVMLVYVGMTQLELTDRELGTPVYLHRSFQTMGINMLSYPGNTFYDMDCESSGYYEGKLPGTVSISGYSKEYREHQLLISPILKLTLEGNDILPAMPLDKIVDRIRLLRLRPTHEDNVALRDILGLSQLTILQSGWFSTNARQRQIEAICMALSRSIYEVPDRFLDFSKERNISSNTLGTTTQGIGLGNFLFQILLGAELLIRLRKEPVTTSYASLITDAISALVVLSSLWMHNVVIQGPVASTTTPGTSASGATTTPAAPRYKLVATLHQLQAEGLIRFGEALSWPYMDEARNYIENAYQDLISGRGVIGFDICDWLFGLVLPGKIFRHRVMCCLVAASPTIRFLGPAPFWDNGLVAKNKSYWPKRSVLGRVLGGLKGSKSVCGWIGPAPAPKGRFSSIPGWVRLNARRVDIPTPVNTAQSTLESLGFGHRSGLDSPEAILQNITDANEWVRPNSPQRPANDTSRSVLQAINLTEILGSATVDLISANAGRKEYRASLEFKINGVTTTYTLYSNPVFVYAPACVGTHTLHRRQAEHYLSNIIKVADLKDAYPPSDSLVIIDALGEEEEVVARAWCAERGKHAVIRRDGECCFACAIVVTIGRTGLGFNVLIWSG